MNVMGAMISHVAEETRHGSDRVVADLVAGCCYNRSCCRAASASSEAAHPAVRGRLAIGVLMQVTAPIC